MRAHGGGDATKEGEWDGAYGKGGELGVKGGASVGKGRMWAKPEKVRKGLLGSAT